jgi:hypothetical protein
MPTRVAGRHVLATLGGLSWAVLVSVFMAAQGAVPSGTPEKARAYYGELAKLLQFSTPETILDSTLDDVPRYLGYAGLSGRDLEQLPSFVLMDPLRLGQQCEPQSSCETAVGNPTEFRRTFSVLPLRPGDILAARFLAPKIANVSESAETRAHGWRKLVRLQARSGSRAASRGIAAGIILFNFFTKPGEKPFVSGAESVNTQVMLLSTPAAVRKQDALYWLDYGPLTAGGKLSLKLDATFEAGDLQGDPAATKPYFVPDGCVACHGENPERAMVNYLDTDHWFDRLANDFSRVRDEGTPVVFDGGADTSSPQFALAFDVIRRFNEEAERQAAMAQRNSFHVLAGRNWLKLHKDNNSHIPAIDRGIPAKRNWNPASDNDRELLDALNRYCFRCHGTIKFNVFERPQVFDRRAVIVSRLLPTQAQLKANPAFLMPPDRKLPDADRDRILTLLHSMEK